MADIPRAARVMWSEDALEIAYLPFQLALTIYGYIICILYVYIVQCRLRDKYYMRNDCVIDCAWLLRDCLRYPQ